jgi:fatty acid-binding protein DegV
MPVAVVTDSTAYLPPKLAEELTVVPLVVVMNGVEGREGVDVTPADVARALQARRFEVTTSRPSPADFVTAYRTLLAAGADGIVSVHLSSKLSGTYEAATLAAAVLREVAAGTAGDADVSGDVALSAGSAHRPGDPSPLPQVAVVDSGSTGMGLGFAALAAAAAARRGEPIEAVRAEALSAVGRTTTLFYVDTLEFLRRGGRIGAASALVGTALSVKPILWTRDGEIVVREKVRTASRALARMVDLAVEAAEESDVDIAVHHVAAQQRADEVATAVRARLGGRLRNEYVIEAGAAVAAHVGPGFAGMVVYRLP